MNRKLPLEEFIREHRAEFDDLKAPAHIWYRIQGDAPKEYTLWKYSAIAASALLLIAIGYILGTHINNWPEIAGWKEYEETEQYYETRVREKMDQIKTLPVSEEVMADIQVLDDVYHQLKSELMEDPNADTQVLLAAMIRHQEQKLEVMEKILNRVDKYHTHEKKDVEM